MQEGVRTNATSLGPFLISFYYYFLWFEIHPPPPPGFLELFIPCGDEAKRPRPRTGDRWSESGLWHALFSPTLDNFMGVWSIRPSLNCSPLTLKLSLKSEQHIIGSNPTPVRSAQVWSNRSDVSALGRGREGPCCTTSKTPFFLSLPCNAAFLTVILFSRHNTEVGTLHCHCVVAGVLCCQTFLCAMRSRGTCEVVCFAWERRVPDSVQSWANLKVCYLFDKLHGRESDFDTVHHSS